MRVGRQVVARLSAQSAERLGLKAGLAWDESLARIVAAAAAEDEALRDAMRVLGRRAIGSRELRNRLRRKGHADATTDTVIEGLTARGLLNDEAYARLVVEAELARKPAGRRLLEARLFRKQIPGAIARRVVEQAVGARDPVADARRLAEKKLRSPTLQRCDPLRRKQRLWGALARRGFDAETIEAALRNAPLTAKSEI